MAIGAKKLQVFHHVISMVSIQMMNLKHQLLPVPVPDSAYLAVGIAIQNPTHILSLQIHRFDLCPITEQLIIRTIDQLTFIVPSVPSFRQSKVKMGSIQTIFNYLSFQRPIVASYLWNAQPVQTIKNTVRFGDRLFNTHP